MFTLVAMDQQWMIPLVKNDLERLSHPLRIVFYKWFLDGRGPEVIDFDGRVVRLCPRECWRQRGTVGQVDY